MKPTEQQTKRINTAFDRISKEIVKYLNTCYNNGSPVKSLSVQAGNNGSHIKTSVRYHRTRELTPNAPAHRPEREQLKT